MNLAAQQLVGSHNFATFGQPPQGNNFVRELYQADWTRSDEMLTFRIEANAFVPHGAQHCGQLEAGR